MLCARPRSANLPMANAAELAYPLTLAEGTEVRLTLSAVDEDYDPLAAVIGIGDSGRTDGADNHDKYIYGKIRP